MSKLRIIEFVPHPCEKAEKKEKSVRVKGKNIK